MPRLSVRGVLSFCELQRVWALLVWALRTALPQLQEKD